MGLQGGAERDLRPSRSADGLESRRCQRQHPRCAARAAVGVGIAQDFFRSTVLFQQPYFTIESLISMKFCLEI